MCSPDDKRYKEFCKNGAIKYYMPVWQFDELQLVAAYIRNNVSDEFLKEALTPEEVERRYHRFGGIFRYVIPFGIRALNDALERQRSVLEHSKPIDIITKGAGIERRDDNRENVSDFLLQYDVTKKPFCYFTMMIASEFVEEWIETQTPTIEEIEMSLDVVKRMFVGASKEVPWLFRYVVYHLLQDSTVQWYISNGQDWVKRCFVFKSSQIVARSMEKEVLKNMEPHVLYRPADQTFFAVDMLWAEQNNSGHREYFGIQATFAEPHGKSKRVYRKLYGRLGLKKEDRVTIYIIPNPAYANSYAKMKRKDFFKPQLEEDKDFPNNLEFAILCSDDLRPLI
jgi:hypothetical protein